MRAVVVDSLAHSLVELLGPQAQAPELMRAFLAVIENWQGSTFAPGFRRHLETSQPVQGLPAIGEIVRAKL